MKITTVTSRELNQDTSRAKRAVLSGPVFITDRGRPAHLLLSIEAYRKPVGKPRNLADVLAMPRLADIDFDPPRAEIGSRPADLG